MAKCTGLTPILSTIVLALGCSTDDSEPLDVLDGVDSAEFDGTPRSSEDDESQCGPSWDVQDVESYDGSLGLSEDWVRQHQGPVGHRVDLGCTGTLISETLYISAGHCGYAPGQVIQFNYQNAPDGTPLPVQTFVIHEVLEQENNFNYDYAIMELSGTPGREFGYARIGNRDLEIGELVAIIQHPASVPKVVHAGSVFDTTSSLGENWFRYQVDTTGGSSGSGVLNADGYLVGVHTNAGCSSFGSPEGNSGMRMAPIIEHSPTLQALTQRRCKGSTTLGDTPWVQAGSQGLYVDIDTSVCGFMDTPLYFTSLGGAEHGNTTGATSIYSPTRTGFRVYVFNREGRATPEFANDHQWRINWEGVPNEIQQDELCTGQTTPGSTGWQEVDNQTLFVDVDTSECGLDITPQYITSLGGDDRHGRTHGATSIVLPSPTGFRVYVYDNNGDVTPEIAEQRQWQINWRAMPRSLVTANDCTGYTNPGSTEWHQNDDHSLYVDIHTTNCGIDWTPELLTVLGGDEQHTMTSGVTSVEAITPYRFRVTVFDNDAEITPQLANHLDWYVSWSAARR